MKLKNLTAANILLNTEVKKNKAKMVKSVYLPAGAQVVEVDDDFMSPYLKFLLSEGRVVKIEDQPLETDPGDAIEAEQAAE